MHWVHRRVHHRAPFDFEFRLSCHHARPQIHVLVILFARLVYWRLVVLIAEFVLSPGSSPFYRESCYPLSILVMRRVFAHQLRNRFDHRARKYWFIPPIRHRVRHLFELWVRARSNCQFAGRVISGVCRRVSLNMFIGFVARFAFVFDAGGVDAAFQAGCTSMFVMLPVPVVIARNHKDGRPVRRPFCFTGRVRTEFFASFAAAMSVFNVITRIVGRLVTWIVSGCVARPLIVSLPGSPLLVADVGDAVGEDTRCWAAFADRCGRGWATIWQLLCVACRCTEWATAPAHMIVRHVVQSFKSVFMHTESRTTFCNVSAMFVVIRSMAIPPMLDAIQHAVHLIACAGDRMRETRRDECPRPGRVSAGWAPAR